MPLSESTIFISIRARINQLQIATLSLESSDREHKEKMIEYNKSLIKTYKLLLLIAKAPTLEKDYVVKLHEKMKQLAMDRMELATELTELGLFNENDYLGLSEQLKNLYEIALRKLKN